MRPHWQTAPGPQTWHSPREQTKQCGTPLAVCVVSVGCRPGRTHDPIGHAAHKCSTGYTSWKVVSCFTIVLVIPVSEGGIRAECFIEFGVVQENILDAALNRR